MAKQATEDEVPVKLPSGAVFYVHPEEFGYLKERVQRYTTDHVFTSVSDLTDLDRILIEEMLCFRWGIWITRQHDYWGDPVDPNELQKALKEHSVETRGLKKSLGIDRPTRDKTEGDDSPTAYLKALLARGKELGIVRNKQAVAAINLFSQLSALLTLHDNADEIERKENSCTSEDLLEWIRDYAVPEYEKIDTAFRQTSQKYWTGTL